MRKTRVLIADDHAMVRTGLRMLLESQPDMKVAGEAADAAATLRMAHDIEADVLLLDLAMPGAVGASLVGQVVRAKRGLMVLVLTMHDDPAYARAALAAGASGYLIKQAAGTELLSAIRAVRQGRTFVDVHLAKDNARRASKRPPGRGLGVLSSREQEVLLLLAHGHTNKAIGEKLGVGTKSVETYRSRLATKLGLRTRADCVEYALETGLLAKDTGPRRPRNA